MKIFDVLNKDYDELTDKEKKMLTTLGGAVIGTGGFVAGICIGRNIGHKQAYTQAKSQFVKMGKTMYTQGAIDGIAGTMYVAHEYSPESFKELMKMAQDKGFKGMYDLGLNAMEQPKGLFELHH